MSSADEAIKPTDRDPETGLFLKGKIGGPGRPKGAKNKLQEAFWKGCPCLGDSWRGCAPAMHAQ